MSQRILAVDGLLNARDLGGLPLLRGGETPTGVFYRSETADRIAATGWDQLYAKGIRSIVDLRAAAERERDRQPRPEWLTTAVADLDGPENRDFWPYFEDSGLDGTAAYFTPLLAAMPERMGSVLTALAEAPPGGVLFHCAGGRDRTGLTAMVLLALVGVEPAAIVADYLETLRLGGSFEMTTDANHELTPIDDLLAGYGTTAEKAFEEALSALDLDDLLPRAGVPRATRETLESWRGHLPRS